MSINFIDFEVFKSDWVAVIINPMRDEERVIINNVEELAQFHEEHKKEIYVGYNIRGYDQFIFKGLLLGLNPKEINDFIIAQGKSGWQFTKAFNNVSMFFFDIKTDLNSLKQLEGFMGSSIEESSVPFDIDRKLTAAELAEVVHYCRHDVEETIKVFMARKEEFTSQLELIKMFRLGLDNMGKSKPQLSAMILKAEHSGYVNDEFEYSIPKNNIVKYISVVDWYKDWKNRDYAKKLELDVAGVPHVFAWGGIHGAIPNYHERGYFLNVDVASYYPSMMIKCGYESAWIRDKKKFTEIYHKRLAYKAAHDKKQAPLKIVLNSTYGAMKDKCNPLYDPKEANNVCVTGQIWLLDLIEHLEPVCDIIQSNTDGVLVKMRANNEKEAAIQYALIDNICYEWEQRTGMNLEFDEYREIWQKDVNNYIIIDETGHHKSKGAYVKSLSALDYDLPIINKALVAYMTQGTPISQTILNCDELREFQKIVKLSGKYSYVMHGEEIQDNKCFRVFASNAFGNKSLYKVKVGGNPEKFANTPDNCFIDNRDMSEKKCPNILDKQWYIDLAEKRMKDFMGE